MIKIFFVLLISFYLNCLANKEIVDQIQLRRQKLTGENILENIKSNPSQEGHFFQLLWPDVGLTADYVFGTPGVKYPLRIETATLGLWIVGPDYQHPVPLVYDPKNSKTSRKTNKQLDAFSAEEWLFGNGYYDVFGDDKFNQSFNLIYQIVTEFTTNPALKFSGILGLGWQIGDNTLKTGPDAPIAINLLNKYPKKMFTLWFDPTSKNLSTEQWIQTFGGLDTKHCKSDINYVSILPTINLENQFSTAFRVDGFEYDKFTRNQDYTGLLDSGSAFVYFPVEVFYNIVSLFNADFDFNTNTYLIKCDQRSNFKDFVFKINGKEYTMSAQSVVFDLDPKNNICFIGILDSLLVHADFVFGLEFMKLYCSVFNLDTNQVGLATML